VKVLKGGATAWRQAGFSEATEGKQKKPAA